MFETKRHAPLPDAWIDAIFARLTLLYGTNFLRLWASLDMTAVKAHWADELSGFQRHPEAIRYALEMVDPDCPPNVRQFRRLCLCAPAPKLAPLPPPHAALSEEIKDALVRLRAELLLALRERT